MRLSLEESSLIPDYIQTITASEKIIWQGKMQLNHLRIAPKLEIPIELIFILIALITFLCTGGHYLFLYKLALIIITISSLIYYNKSQKKENRQNKIKFNEYLITTSQIVFIHWHDQNIHLNTLPLSNVKKVLISPIYRLQKSLYIIPRHPVNFRTYNYWNDQKNPYITISNVASTAAVHKLLKQLIK